MKTGLASGGSDPIKSLHGRVREAIAVLIIFTEIYTEKFTIDDSIKELRNLM